MNTFGNTKAKTDVKNILGGTLGFFEEENYEKETSLVSSAAKGSLEAVVSLFQDVAGTKSKDESEKTTSPILGSIEFNKVALEQKAQEKQRTEINRKRIFFQALKEDQDKAQRDKDRVFEEEINDLVANLPTDQKNQLLGYQASYRDKSIYQRAELRKKIIEQRKQAEMKEKDASIPSPAKQPSAMEGAFEGRSGSQGGGSANLSAQAVG